MKSPKVSKKTIEQVIDLGEIFGVDATDAPALKESLAQAIIDYIVERTQSGKAYGGGKLKSPYSPEYVKSREFKAAGKSAGEVDLELTGDMLASIGVLSTSGNKIKIGITDELQVLKAYNHQTGDTVPARPFFGVTKTDLDQIGDDFSSDFDNLKSTADKTTGRQQKLLDLLSEIQGSEGSGVVDVDDSFDDGG